MTSTDPDSRLSRSRPDSRSSRSRRILFWLSLALSLCACRNSKGGTTGAQPILPNTQGSNGCSGPDQVFSAPQAPAAVALTTLVIGPLSQITAAAGGELLYATGANATIVSIDLSGATPVEEVIVPSGSGVGTAAELLATAGILAPAQLSGIAVLDADTLVVMEHTAHVLLSVKRLTPHTIDFFAGQPNAIPGFADGLARGTAGLARFSFVVPSQVCPSGDALQRVFVADAGNHAVRVVGADNVVRTIAGSGVALFADGALSQSFFDTPTGLSIACSGLLVVSETGVSGFGNRLRALEIGATSPFGGFFGSATTLAGDGTDATTQGPSLAGAQLARPVSPLATAQGDIYWIDSATGVLRRRKLDGACDCPLSADCASAVAAGEFPAGHAFSLTETTGGKLFVLDATAGVLYRVTP